MQLQFYKYQGTGNDFIMIDDRDNKFPTENVALVAKLCDRKFGIGADGLILLQNHNQASYYMKYYNSDGNESTMCGNGGRCLAAFALHIGVVNGAHAFMAIDGLHDAEFEGELTDSVWIKLKMKDVDDIDARPENVFVLNTGSPHYVQFVYENLAALNLIDDAKHIRYGAEYAAKGINVNFINLLGLHHINMRTYERGVEDETLSCGTGVTAAALSAALLNNLPNGVHTTKVTTCGGDLKVTFMFNSSNSSFNDIWLQGPATRVFTGSIKI